MTVSDTLEKVEQIAKMADIRGQRRENLLGFLFSLQGGRDQLVYVGELGETDEGMTVICFFSPCQRRGSGFLKGLSKGDALNLLRLTAQMPFGHFCIMELGGEELVCVRATQILETMEVQEFQSHITNVALAADAWEKKVGGGDEF